MWFMRISSGHQEQGWAEQVNEKKKGHELLLMCYRVATAGIAGRDGKKASSCTLASRDIRRGTLGIKNDRSC